MAPHSSTVARKIPWTEEPGGLQSMGLLRVRHNWLTSFSLSAFMHWRRKWQPTPVFLPGESHGRRSLVGCSPWGRTESDTTEATWQQAAHTSKVMLKILQARLQQYMNCELTDVQAGLEKAEESEIKLPISVGLSKKQESSRKYLLLLYWLCQSLWLCGSQQTLENS